MSKKEEKIRISEDEIRNLLHARPASKASAEIINRKLKSVGIISFRGFGEWSHSYETNQRDIEHSSGFVIWFGVDACGYIFKANAHSTYHVPQFVANRYKYTKTLEDYFYNEELKKRIFEYEIIEFDEFTEYFIEDEYEDLDEELIEEAKNIAKMEFIEYPYWYKKMTQINPENPLKIDQLPEKIMKIMESQKCTMVDAHNTNYFFIPKLKSNK